MQRPARIAAKGARACDQQADDQARSKTAGLPIPHLLKRQFIDRQAEDLRGCHQVFRVRIGLRGFPFGDRLAADAERFGKLFLG